MNNIELTISYPNENSFFIEWPEKICPVQHQAIMLCQHKIDAELSDYLIDTVASYNSLMLYYRLDKISLKELDDKINSLLIALKPSFNNLATLDTDIVDIPVYYGNDAAWDMQWLAHKTQLSIREIIQLHSESTYRAYALGFTPGFCYLGTLDKKLQLPRRQSPRLTMPKGAVAIAEQQTAVYPNVSPGGWHIIGQTPIPMYKVVNNTFIPCIKVGQQVRFHAITYSKFCELGGCLSVNQTN